MWLVWNYEHFSRSSTVGNRKIQGDGVAGKIPGGLVATLPSLKGVCLSLYGGWKLQSSLWGAETVVEQGRPRREFKTPPADFFPTRQRTFVTCPSDCKHCFLKLHLLSLYKRQEYFTNILLRSATLNNKLALMKSFSLVLFHPSQGEKKPSLIFSSIT